jgi:hypothetical protein
MDIDGCVEAVDCVPDLDRAIAADTDSAKLSSGPVHRWSLVSSQANVSLALFAGFVVRWSASSAFEHPELSRS